MQRHKCICVFGSQICMNVHSSSKGLQEIHGDVNRVSSLQSKITGELSSPLYFLFPNFCPRILFLHDWKKKKTRCRFLNSCFSVSAIENASQWIYGGCKVGQPILSGHSPDYTQRGDLQTALPQARQEGTICFFFSWAWFPVISIWVAPSFAAHLAFGEDNLSLLIY